jgi:hypothetical protein
MNWDTRKMAAVVNVGLAITVLALVTFWPEWRLVLQVQAYSSGPPFPAGPGECWYYEDGQWQTIGKGSAEHAGISVSFCGPEDSEETPVIVGGGPTPALVLTLAPALALVLPLALALAPAPAAPARSRLISLRRFHSTLRVLRNWE